MSAFTGTVAATGIGRPPSNALGNALASTQAAINNAVNPTMQGPIQKTFTDGKGVIRYVGSGARVPGEIVRQLRLRQATAARAQAAAKRDGRIPATPPPPPAPTPAEGNGSGATGSSTTSVEKSPLGALGAPDEKNVSRIVNSIIADATSQYRWAAQDARKRAQSDLTNVAQGALGFDRLGQTAAAANKGYTDAFLTQSTGAQNAEAAAAAQYRQSLEANSQTGGTPLEYTVDDADAAGAGVGAQTEGSQMGAANQAFFDMSRIANATSAQQSGKDIRAAYATELQQNQRAIAAERAKRALYEQQIKKDLWDQHIAKRMAEAEIAQRGSSLLNDQVSREGAKAQLAQAKSEKDWKQYEVINSILLGTGQEVEIDTGKVNKNGEPITVKKMMPMGQASTWNEALKRLRLAGIANQSTVTQAKQLWGELQTQEGISSGVNTAIGGIGNFFGNPWFPSTEEQ